MAHIYHDSERDTNTDSGVSLTFSIESANGCAPRIRLTLELRRPEHALNSRSQQVPVHSGSIDLAFGHIFKKSNDESTTPNQIFNLKVDYAQEHSNAIISFDTTGATANNLKCLIDFPEGHDRVRNMRLRDYEVEMAKQLCSLTTIPEGKVKHVVIMVQPHPKEKDLHKAGQHNAVDDLLDALPFEGNVSPSLKQPMTVLPYDQLRNASHKPRVQHGQMPQPFKVFDKNHACMPMPPRHSWQDADEASIVLANSVEVQHIESSIILSSLEKNEQKIKLLTVGDMVLIAITYDKCLRAGLSTDERISFPTGTVMKFTIKKAKSHVATTETVKPYFANGKVISNIHNIVCDTLVAVEGKKAVDFVGLTAPLTSSKTATSYWAWLSSKISENNCAAMIKAVAVTYTRRSWVTEKWPALLNDGGYLASRHLATSITCSHEQFKKALDTLNNAHQWNKAQRAHIDAFLRAPGGMALLTGSSGSGKTEVMVHVMRFCLRVGINVLCLGMKHSTLDLIVKKYENKFPEEEQPLRAYKPYMEDLTSMTTEWDAGEESELLVLEIARAELVENKNKRSRLIMTNSIQYKVIENSKKTDMPGMMRKFPSGSQNGEPVYTDESLYDFRQVFRDGLAAREKHPFSDKIYWTDQRSKRFKYAYAALRAEVIQNARLLVTTMINIGSNEISQNFSRDTPIARFDDEAQACSEQPSLIASATCKFSHNICVWAFYGDFRQSGVINLTGRNPDNTVDVFYKQTDMSLFLRLYLSGHPVVRLDIQWRQHEKLFRPLNELHYDLNISTVQEMNRDLDEHTRLMGKITGQSDSKIDKQSDYQKRLLHIVLDSPTMKAKDSPSRANPGFAAYVVGVIFPKVREEFGITTSENVMLVVPYAKHKELYQRHYAQLRAEGWTDAELPALTTIEVAHGHEANLVIFDAVNDNREGFLQDAERCCVAFSRAKQQMIFVSGRLLHVKSDITKTVVVRTTDGRLARTDVYRPLLHWAKYCVDHSCQWHESPPAFKVPSDLAFYGNGSESVQSS
ncbi:hypothetical protein D6D18_07949 [Aureobasidium pullulans]|nr:hypothetical protein D6D18_07949 [Aureobasidium pullulans]